MSRGRWQNGAPWLEMLRSIIRTLVPAGETFTIEEVYAYEDRLAKEFPKNRHIRETVRDKLQELRDLDEIKFLDYGGNYRRLV